MLCGRLPFEGESMGEVLVKQVAHPPPSLRGLEPSVPLAVEAIVLRCLAKTPATRFQSMGDLRAALLDPQRALASAPSIVPAAASEQRTMIEPSRPGSGDRPPVAPPAGAAPVTPGLAPPVPASDGTMARMTAAAHRRSPRRGRRAMAVLVLAAAAGASVVVGLTSESGEGAPGAPARARIRLNTRPPGAAVSDASGRALGVTPAVVELVVDGRPVTLVFRHPDAEPLAKTFVPDSDTSLDVELAPRASAAPPGSPPPAPAGLAPAPVPVPVPDLAGTVPGPAPDPAAPAEAPRTPAAATDPDRGPAAARPAATRPETPARSERRPSRRRPGGRRVGDGTLAPEF
jgi:serine/threonine-protein kinase